MRERFERASGRSTQQEQASRKQIAGAALVTDALRAGHPVRCVFILAGERSAATQGLVELCAERGVPLREASERELKRLAKRTDREEETEVIALEGLAPDAPLADVLTSPGAVWLLTDVAYPGNAGFAIRTAEVSGAAGIVLDTLFDHDGRRQALRKSMRADRLFPVLFATAVEVIELSLAAGRRIIGIEDGGSSAPWDVDLTGPVLFIVGGEATGVPSAVLERCENVVRIPMAGFIPSHNLQAAVAIIAGERLRQTGFREAQGPDP